MIATMSDGVFGILFVIGGPCLIGGVICAVLGWKLGDDGGQEP